MINNEIKAATVRLVSDNGSEVLALSEALKKAQGAELDLVCINDKAEIPVVKIIDYEKYTYEQKKRERENKKKAREKAQDIKDIQITENIALNDIKTKARNIDRILKDNDKVRLSIRYKGRTMRNIAGGPEKLNNVIYEVTEKFKVDKPMRTDGNTVSIVLAPVRA